MKKKQTWVSKDFHSLLKKRAIEEDMSLLGFTDKVAKEGSFFNEEPLFSEKKKKRLRL